MLNWIKLLMPLTLNAAADGGGTAEAGSEADAPTPVGEDHFAEMRQQQELRAGIQDTATDTEGGETGDGAEESTEAAGETGKTAADTAAETAKGKDATPEYVPKARFDEVWGKVQDLTRELAELKKAGTQQQTTQAEPAWKAQLKPMPLREGYMKDGKLTEWESTEAYLDARQDALTHNARVEADGKAAETRAADDAKVQETKRAADAAAWRKNYVEKTVPDFIKAEGITQEQFTAAIDKAPSIPILDAATGDSIGIAIQQLSKDAARFSYAISTSPAEALTPYAAEIMASAPGPARTAKIIEVVGRMDALLMHGLGFDGKPRAAGGAKGLTSAGASERSQAQRASRTTTVVTSTEGGGGAGGEATATGEAHFNAMRAKQQRQTQAKLAGLKR